MHTIAGALDHPILLIWTTPGNRALRPRLPATRRWQQFFEEAVIAIPKGSPEEIERDMAVIAAEAYQYCKQVTSSAVLATRPQMEVSVRGAVSPLHIAMFRAAILSVSLQRNEEAKKAWGLGRSDPAHGYLLTQLAPADAMLANDAPSLQGEQVT